VTLGVGETGASSTSRSIVATTAEPIANVTTAAMPPLMSPLR
jgi:hypothetical protein